MIFEVTILGSSSATPAHNRNPSAQILNHNEKLYLIDCGEGTQFQLNRYRIKANRIDHIFITHLHGDHYLGLMGLLSSLHLNGRSKEIKLFAPEPLLEIIKVNLQHSFTELRFELKFFSVDTTKHQLIFENKELEVYTIPLEHRIPCAGYLFKEKPKKRKLNLEAIESFGIGMESYPLIREGFSVISPSGDEIKNEVLSYDPIPQRSYAYCSDTIYLERILPIIQGVNVLYHEATFMHDLLDRAVETYHTTCLQAGIIARRADVKKLIIGHFSARYKDLTPLLEESRNEFSNTYLATEGERFIIG